ncbi:adhesion G protein-coupled receptor E3-like isoform X3 [Centruroides sculpturatus]|uniref:adhesion G protein-coupled receptor E3-like isoform X3 n=1 Tax=Centruroides sculpturatus TaxID=218467 RepID=UPI000C6DC0BE|nr:adhesion G protein-coupled receptor E3-like isoform X3 [Centruroides sculpturatus]
MSATSIFFKNLTEYLPEHYFTRLGGLDIEYQLHSQPVAVSFKGIGIENLINTQSISIRVKMAHLKNKSQMLKNITCGIADFSDNKFDFLMDGCQVISVRGNYTTCQCYRMGMYAVLLTSFTNAKSSNQDEFEIIAGIGCSIGAFLLCLTFFMLLILWKKLRGAITALKLQVCIALIGAYIAILKSLQESLSKEYYSYILSIIQFFLLAAFSMQLCLGLIVYIEFTNLQSIKYPELKVAAMGWAVPTIVVGATLASQVPEGFLIESWWLKFGTNFFLSYTIAVIIIFVLQLILFLTVKAEIRHHQKEESPKQKIIGNRTKLLCRSLVISVTLLLTSVFSILYINYEDDIFKYLFSFSSAALGLIVFLCYTFCSENAFLLCCPKTSNDNDDEKEEPKLNTESNSFRSFLKPEIVGETACYLNKFSDHMDKRTSLDQIHKLKPQVEICREPDWLETGCLLQEKKPNLKSATVQSVSKHKHKNGKGKNFDINESEDARQISPQKFRWRHIDPSKASSFELEPMYDSPRSNFHGKTLESVIEEENPDRTSLPPPYQDSSLDAKKDYSIKSNPLSLFDSRNQENLKTDLSALMVSKNSESTNSASSKTNHSNSTKAADQKGVYSDGQILHDATQTVPPIKLDVTNIETTPDDCCHPTNSVADLISRDDDFATEMDMPLVVTENVARNDQVSPSRKSWSMTSV